MSHYTAGLDVHKQSTRICVLDQDEILIEKTIPTDAKRIQLELEKAKVRRCCYEAGPTGFDLYRSLTNAGIDCQVIAPSKIPTMPGDRVKTDTRDARKLAMLFQAGMLTTVNVPTVEIEAVRDLLRVRDAARLDRTRHRQRIGKFLLRYSRDMPTKSWTKTRRRWLGEQSFDQPAAQLAYTHLLETVDLADRRLEAIESDLFAYADHPSLKELVGRLRCIRGFNTLSALTLAAEVGDFNRFKNAQAFMSFTGLTPSEHSSGESRSQGSITRNGNQFIRRILIEAANNNRRKPSISTTLASRHINQNPQIVDHAMKCQHRLHKRWQRMQSRGKPHNKTVCAVARELAGFTWAIATT